MIAMRRDEPHWLLNDGDARQYGQALQNALRHIPITRAQKTLDFAMLVIAAGQFEIPRVYLSAQLARQRAAQAHRGGPAPVFQFRPPPSPASPPSPPGGPSPQSSPAGGTGGGAAARANGQGVPLDMTYEPEADEPHIGP